MTMGADLGRIAEKRLAERLREVKYGIRSYMTEEIRKEHRQFLSLDRIYHNAYISRPYAIYADNRTDAPRRNL